MRLRFPFLLLAAAALVLSGCATKPQEPVSLSAPMAGQRIGVAMTALPKAEVHLPGASCLLCIMAATAMNQGLSKHTDSLTAEDLPALKELAAAALRKKGANAVVIAEPLDMKTLASGTSTEANVAPNDFRPLARKYQVDKLLVIEIRQLGFERNYSAYIPTSDPKALLRGRGYMVNLANNTYEWYLPLSVTRSADGAWDEPEKFPGLTNAYYQALELGKDSLLRPLSDAQ